MNARATTDATRLIPAHAGKTLHCLVGAGHAEAHPRSRGENFERAADVTGTIGSSPLTRGKLPAVGLDRCPRRLIPAHAGKTTSCASVKASCAAHPRSRGENEAGDEKGSTFDGSSPLTRGKRVPVRREALEHRLIPAHAGKTQGQREI